MLNDVLCNPGVYTNRYTSCVHPLSALENGGVTERYTGFCYSYIRLVVLTCSPGGPGSPGFPVGGGGGGVGGRVGTPVRGIFNPGRHPTRSPVKFP